MHEIYIERAAEKDLKKLSAEDFNRIVPTMKALTDERRAPDAEKLPAQKVTGEFVLANTE